MGPVCCFEGKEIAVPTSLFMTFTTLTKKPNSSTDLVFKLYTRRKTWTDDKLCGTIDMILGKQQNGKGAVLCERAIVYKYKA